VLQTLGKEAVSGSESVKVAFTTSDVLGPFAAANARPYDASTNKKTIPRHTLLDNLGRILPSLKSLKVANITY
jgi:hypothetical protein